jgi:hypothetical protein
LAKQLSILIISWDVIFCKLDKVEDSRKLRSYIKRHLFDVFCITTVKWIRAKRLTIGRKIVRKFLYTLLDLVSFAAELGRVQVPQVKVLYLYLTNMDLYLYFYFEKITWYLYLYFEQILLYFYLSTKTGTFHFVLEKYIKYIM